MPRAISFLMTSLTSRAILWATSFTVIISPSLMVFGRTGSGRGCRGFAAPPACGRCCRRRARLGRLVVCRIAADRSRLDRGAGRDVAVVLQRRQGAAMRERRDAGREVRRDVGREVRRDVGREVRRDVGREVHQDVGREVRRDVGREVRRALTGRSAGALLAGRSGRAERLLSGNAGTRTGRSAGRTELLRRLAGRSGRALRLLSGNAGRGPGGPPAGRNC